MGYTIAEKILLAHTDKKSIKSGEFIYTKVDLCLGNDITAPLAIREFYKAGFKKIFDKERIALILDHFTPSKDVRSASQHIYVREFAKKYNIKHYYEMGRGGIEHALLPEIGLTSPNNLIIGADSHTCTYGGLGAFATGVGSTDLAVCFTTGKCWFRVPETIKFVYRGELSRWADAKDLILFTISDIGVDGALYKVMEFEGEVIKGLSIEERLTMCNMAIEAGAETGIIAPDKKAWKYMEKTSMGNSKNEVLLKSDKDAKFVKIKEYNVTNMEPQIAIPHSPGNVKPISKVKKVQIDQSVIGSCTNGRISDLRKAAKILKGRQVHPDVRLIIIPATQNIYKQAIKEGFIGIFIEAGAVISPPTCGPCIGGHMGVLGKREVAISTTNRNFKGRMGHPDSLIYLSNPQVAAASAIAGKIIHPGNL